MIKSATTPPRTQNGAARRSIAIQGFIEHSCCYQPLIHSLIGTVTLLVMVHETYSRADIRSPHKVPAGQARATVADASLKRRHTVTTSVHMRQSQCGANQSLLFPDRKPLTRTKRRTD
jgi:hypothetical protein